LITRLLGAFASFGQRGLCPKASSSSTIGTCLLRTSCHSVSVVFARRHRPHRPSAPTCSAPSRHSVSVASARRHRPHRPSAPACFVPRVIRSAWLLPEGIVLVDHRHPPAQHLRVTRSAWLLPEGIVLIDHRHLPVSYLVSLGQRGFCPKASSSSTISARVSGTLPVKRSLWDESEDSPLGDQLRSVRARSSEP